MGFYHYSENDFTYSSIFGCTLCSSVRILFCPVFNGFLTPVINYMNNYVSNYTKCIDAGISKSQGDVGMPNYHHPYLVPLLFSYTFVIHTSP